MAAIKVGNLTVEITVHNIDGIVHQMIHLPMRNGFWVYLTVQNESGKRESFPLVDEDYSVKIYDSYSLAIEDTATLLMKYND